MSGKPAARVTDPVACPIPGHGTSSIVSGSPDVFIDGLASARQSDSTGCGGKLSSNVVATVLLNGLPAATKDSVGSHGNVVTGGSGTVIIGNNGYSEASSPFELSNPLKRKRIIKMYWTYGEEEHPLSDQSRFYVDLNLHIETENYAPGESIAVTIAKANDDSISEGITELKFTAVVGEKNKAAIMNIFSTTRIDIVMPD